MLSLKYTIAKQMHILKQLFKREEAQGLNKKGIGLKTDNISNILDIEYNLSKLYY